jgi:hypothetical protein
MTSVELGESSATETIFAKSPSADARIRTVSFPGCETVTAMERRVSPLPELGEHAIENTGGYCDPVPHRMKYEIKSRPFTGMIRFCHEIATPLSVPLMELLVTFDH